MSTITTDDGRVVTIEQVIETLPERTTTFFIDRSSTLAPEQVQLLLDGLPDDARDAEREAINIEASIEREAVDLLQKQGIDFWSLDVDQCQQVCDAIDQACDDDPLVDELRNRSRYLVRVPLTAFEATELEPSEYRLGNHGLRDNAMSDQMALARTQHVVEALAAYGFDAIDQRTDILEMVDNGPWDWHEGVVLDLLVNIDVRDLLDQTLERRTGTIVFHNPALLLADGINGSGFDIELHGDVRVELGPVPDEPPTGRRMMLDALASPCWDTVAGLVHSAYDTEFTIVEPAA